MEKMLVYMKISFLKFRKQLQQNQNYETRQ